MKVSADYRMLALDALRGKWKTAVLTGIAASALGATIVSSSNSAVSNSNQAKDIHFELFSQPNGGRLLAVLLAGIVLWAVLQLIVGGAVQLGYAHFNLNLVDGNDAAISDLFSQKDRLWDGFCMKFLQGLYIALWSLLLMITPCAPAMLVSSSGEEIAALAAFSALPAPLALPTPMWA